MASKRSYSGSASGMFGLKQVMTRTRSPPGTGTNVCVITILYETPSEISVSSMPAIRPTGPTPGSVAVVRVRVVFSRRRPVAENCSAMPLAEKSSPGGGFTLNTMSPAISRPSSYMAVVPAA